MSQEDEVSAEDRPAVDQADQLKSYLSFAGRALKKRIFLAIGIFAGLALATVVTFALWPRSFHCQSTLMVQGNVVLDSAEIAPFSGASSVILRHENLLAMVRETGLAKRVLVDRPPLLRVKDRLMGLSQASERDLELMAVGTLERAISVNTWENNLIIGVEWNNAEMAARLVKLAQKSFLEARHVAEISTISEKMAILDAHSTELRKEIEAIAAQLRDLRDEKIADIGKTAGAAPAAPSPAAGKTPAPRPAARDSNKLSAQEIQRRKDELAELKAELDKKKSSLEALKADRSGRLLAAQEQRTSLLGVYTPAHPEVRKVDRLIQSLTGESPPMVNLRQEIAALSEQIQGKTRIAEVGARSAGSAGSAAAAPASDPAAVARGATLTRPRRGAPTRTPPGRSPRGLPAPRPRRCSGPGSRVPR